MVQTYLYANYQKLLMPLRQQQPPSNEVMDIAIICDSNNNSVLP